MSEERAALWRRYDEIRRQHARNLVDESHLTNQRTLHWCREYRRTCTELIGIVDKLVAAAARDRRERI